MKKLFTVLLCLIAIVCATGLVACGGGNGTPSGHVHTVGRETIEDETPATCTEEGGYYKVFYCSVCGEEMGRDYERIMPLTHDWGEWEETTPVTCTENGEKTRYCRRDGSHYETQTVYSKGHTADEPVKEDYVAAGCESDGYYYEVVCCVVCGEEMSRDYVYLPAKNHAYGDEKVIIAPTCVTFGESEFTCSACGKKKTESTSFLGHNYIDGVCTRCKKADVPATEGITYEKKLYNKGYSVTGYSGSATEVIIADIYDGLPVTNIEYNSFSYNENITSIVIPDSVTTVADSFYGCTSLSTVYLGSGVNSIVSMSFRNCPALEKLYYSGTPSDWAKIGSIENITRFNTQLEYYFSGEKLTEMTIVGAEIIQDYAFYGMSIENVVIGNGVKEIGEYAFSYCQNLTSVTFGDSVEKINSRAFEEDGALETVRIGANKKEFSVFSFNNCSALSEIIYTGSIKEWASEVFGGGNLLSEGGTLHIGGDVLPDALVIEDITEINDGAFCNTAIKSLVLGNTVEKIGDSAFSGCSLLSAISFGSGLKEIGKRAFEDCETLTELRLPKSLLKIGEYAINNCNGINKLYYAGSVSDWASKIDGVNYLTAWNYGGELYVNNNLVTEVVLSGISEIKAGAFSGMKKITAVTLPEGLKTIGTGAFAKTNISDITLPEGLEKIGASAFYHCDSLGEIVIPDSVTDIENDAFESCEGLSKVRLGKGIDHLSSAVFYACTSLKEVVIPNTVQWIGANAFVSCNSISAVYFEGTAEEWQTLEEEIYSGNDYVKNATRYYYSETEPTESGNFWHYVANKPIKW